jgi:hypothetical protein
MTKKSYLPRNNAEFNNWFKNMTKYVELKTSGDPSEWDHILRREQDALNAAYEDWETHYAPTLRPHTSDLTEARNEARSRAERVIRPFVRRNLYCEPVTNADRVYLGLPVRDVIRTDRTSVEEEVEWGFEIRGIRQVHGHFKVFGAQNRAKPEQYNCVVAYEVREPDAPPPERPEDLTRRVNASRTPCTIVFDETERGKKVYMAMAWQNDRRIVGKWSAIDWTFVP